MDIRSVESWWYNQEIQKKFENILENFIMSMNITILTSLKILKK
jgi:hypothetical protein